MPGQFIGTGTTVVFGTSGFTAEILSVDQGNINTEAVDSSHMGTVDWRTFLKGKLFDPGELTLEIGFDPADSPPFSDAAETITITFPDNPGGTGSTYAASGFMSGFEYNDPLEDKMTATMTVKLTGTLTITPHV